MIEYRGRSYWTIADIAKAAGVSRQTVWIRQKSRQVPFRMVDNRMAVFTEANAKLLIPAILELGEEQV